MVNQKQKTVEIYKQKDVVESFDKSRSKYAFQKHKHKIESNFLKGAIRKTKSNKIRVLDVACGTGRMLLEVFSTKKDIEYLGLDTSKEMTKILKKRAKKLGVKDRVKIKLSDASKIPFKDDSFDVVYSFHLLWHLPKEEQEKIIKEMFRVCKKDGFVVFDILNKNFVWEGTKNFIGKEKTGGIHKISINKINKIFEGKEIKIEKLNDFPIRNDSVYALFNIFNHLRNLFPRDLYHMIYFRIKK